MTEPASNDDYAGCLAGALRAATRAVTRSYDELLRPHGVRITQVATLAELRRLEPVSITGLAAALGSERSGVARDVALLEAAGLVRAGVTDQDRRVKELSLTPAGVAKLEQCAPAWREAQAAMRSRLGDEEVRQLVGAALLVVDRLSDEP